jgi:hypothetical protein
MKSLLDSLLRVRRLSKRVRERRRVVGEVASKVKRKRKKGTWLGRLYSKDKLYRKGRLYRKDSPKGQHLKPEEVEVEAKEVRLALHPLLLLLEAVMLDILPSSM